MPRRKRLRRVVAPPGFKGYRPYGHSGGKRGFVELLYEEYEALKLVDYRFMNHLEASKIMGVSRATLARIYESARRKIARALVEQKEIRTVFGNARLDGNWFICGECQARFTLPAERTGPQCPLCKSMDIEQINKSI